MNKTEFLDKQRRMLTTLVLHSNDNPSAIGLLTGQTGIVIVLANYARQYNMPWIEDVADFFMKNITRKINDLGGYGFSSGVSGIGWGIEYLIQNGFMEGDSDEILADIDRKIMRLNVRYVENTSLENGTLGLWHYIRARLQANRESGRSLPFDDRYLHEWVEIISNNPQQYPQGASDDLVRLINGETVNTRLRISEFIPTIESAENRLCLIDGMAGLVMQKYISEP